MADLTTTQLKLRTTPTAGVSSEQSPYYRRLLSAGYKGFLQGTVGGASLYGLIGAAVGTLIAIPAFFVAGPAAFLAIPAMTGLGVFKGAGTFGNIGSVAAITAESAEMSEKRRYLLDRYYDLPATPEYDNEAAQIRDLLAKQHESKPPASMFHLRPVIFGALFGAAIAFTLLAFPVTALGAHALLEPVLGAMALKFTVASGIGIGTLLGGLVGSVMGLDRYYIRSWLDKSASIMHDRSGIEEQLREREREVNQLGRSDIHNATVTEIKGYLPPAHHDIASHLEAAAPHLTAPTRHDLPISPNTIAGLESAPRTQADAIEHHGRAVSPEQALQRPVV